ncbi:MAG: preprotein translocase subunit SecG [Phycisphaerales bacterium]|nr:preprotein translocase subunit SecG [Phycisphaerales bacterium]
MAVLSVILSLLFIIVAVALILVILVQRPQGGGLAGAFGGVGGASSQSAFGAKTGDMLTFATVAMFVLFLLTSMGMVWLNQAQFGASTPAPPDPPSNLAVTIISPTEARLTWKDNSKNETGFFIERSEDGLTGWTEIGNVDAEAITFTDQNLEPESTYFYRVSARNTEGPSTATEAINITLPAAEAQPAEGEDGTSEEAPPTGAEPGGNPAGQPAEDDGN